jgi:3-oxoadipate enol-lactonase
MPRIRVNDIELFYELSGATAGPTVVFVNGLLTDTTSWSAVLPFFTDRYRCLVYDCRGQGRSDQPDHDYTTRLHAADLAGLVAALGIERVSVVGLSNGGAAALEFAADYPQQVAALVVCGAYAAVDTALRMKLTSWLKAMEAGGSVLRFDVATPWVWGPRFLEQNAAQLLLFREKAASMPIVPAVHLIRGALSHDIRHKLGRIAAPTLVVVGEDDVLTPPYLARLIVAGVPGAQLELLPGVGHAAPLEQPETFSRVVRAFFARVASQGAS